jgi:hypothetical protein
MSASHRSTDPIDAGTPSGCTYTALKVDGSLSAVEPNLFGNTRGLPPCLTTSTARRGVPPQVGGQPRDAVEQTCLGHLNTQPGPFARIARTTRVRPAGAAPTRTQLVTPPQNDRHKPPMTSTMLRNKRLSAHKHLEGRTNRLWRR